MDSSKDGKLTFAEFSKIKNEGYIEQKISPRRNAESPFIEHDTSSVIKPKFTEMVNKSFDIPRRRIIARSRSPLPSEKDPSYHYGIKSRPTDSMYHVMSNSYEFAPRAKSISNMNCKIPVINRLKRNRISDLNQKVDRKSRIPDSFRKDSSRKQHISPIPRIRDSSWR